MNDLISGVKNSLTKKIDLKTLPVMLKNRKDEAMIEKEVIIKSKDFWVNIVDFMQQYWALIDEDENKQRVVVYFIHEGSGVFTKMNFKSQTIAEKALLQNGFKKYDDPMENYADFISPPKEPYYMVKLKQPASLIQKDS